MDDSMIDRASTALANSKTRCRDMGFDELDAIVRVVVEAIREPTKAIEDAYWAAKDRGVMSNSGKWQTAPTVMWQAMIDAALVTTPPKL